MTSTLQQSAYNQLGFSVDKTMQLAQKLYEGVPLDDPQSPVALITYMRTDSTRIAPSALKEVRAFIKDEYGADYLLRQAQIYEKNLNKLRKMRTRRSVLLTLRILQTK